MYSICHIVIMHLSTIIFLFWLLVLNCQSSRNQISRAQLSGAQLSGAQLSPTHNYACNVACEKPLQERDSKIYVWFRWCAEQGGFEVARLRKLENINIILEIHCICDLEEVKGEAKSQGIKKHNFVKSYIDDHIKMHFRMVRRRFSVNLLL